MLTSRPTSSPPSYPVFRKVARGLGRDFVMGDVHGAFHLVVRALDALHFDKSVDRLFLVGDLGDRGPYSLAALNFLNQPWVHAVRGNHEQMLLDLYVTGTLDTDALRFHVKNNGMGWWLEVDQSLQAEILDLLDRLPIAMEIETVRGTVGLVHAEVPLGQSWQEFIALLEAGDHRTRQSALWGRVRAKHGDLSGVPGIGRVFVGHTPHIDGVTRLGNVFYIDTGAVFGALGQAPGKLSSASIVAETVMLSTPLPRVLPLLDLYEGGPKRPFGNYHST